MLSPVHGTGISVGRAPQRTAAYRHMIPMREAPPRLQVSTHLASRSAQAPGLCRRRHHYYYRLQTEGSAGVIKEVCFVIRQDLSWLGTAQRFELWGGPRGVYASIPLVRFYLFSPFFYVLCFGALFLSWTFSISLCVRDTPAYIHVKTVCARVTLSCQSFLPRCVS
ncbi:hypothetical protein H4582DRAFT_294742 [Lactarius indigo]|nr:hypothetical protein H4582DRAFT_294742 [Lactarius indigo]